MSFLKEAFGAKCCSRGLGYHKRYGEQQLQHPSNKDAATRTLSKVASLILCATSACRHRHALSNRDQQDFYLPDPLLSPVRSISTSLGCCL